MACEKVGSGPFAGNTGQNPCGQKTSGQAGGNPAVSVNINNHNNMAFPIGALASTALAGMQASKIKQAEAGKVFEPPKTDVGKLIGRLTGRTQASQISEAQKVATSSAPVDMATQKNLSRQGIPVSGGLSFGQAKQGETLKILGILGAVVVSIFYFNRSKGRKRRR